MKVLLDLVLVVLLIATASAFLQSTTRCERITSNRSTTTIFMESTASSTEEAIQQSDDESFRETKNDNSKKIKSASLSSCWSMEMDWTLQDAVPQFTVLSKEHTATFWHSFQAAHPEFKQFSESEMEERYMYLLNNSEQDQEQTTNNALPPCGSSPHLLSEWWILEEKNIMGGILSNGSSTWFPISRGGTLQHQSNSPIDITNFPNLLAIPGGYVVARDGIIYEMGHASKSMMIDMKEKKDQPSQHAPTLMIAHTTQERDKHTRKVILKGIVGSAVLSGVLAFAIGTQFAASLLVAAPISSAPSCPYASSTASHISLLSPSSTATSHVSLRSDSTTITEQRIVQELRVVREKNAVQTLQKAEQTLQDRMKQDEKVLFQLQREETMQEGAALGFY